MKTEDIKIGDTLWLLFEQVSVGEVVDIDESSAIVLMIINEWTAEDGPILGEVVIRAPWELFKTRAGIAKFLFDEVDMLPDECLAGAPVRKK